MPNRIIKESICTSDSLDQLTAFQETFFYRLIVNCDDYGRMDARPKILAAKLFPLKDLRANQIEDALRALTSAELVILYEVGGKPFLQMKTWDRHQQIRARSSRYPSPDDGAITTDGICNQVISDDIKCPRNPIQSESNQNQNPNPKRVREGFDEFWSAYPKKQDKQHAFKAWEKLNPDEETRKTILLSVEKQKQSPQWQKDGGQFIPMPSTWLNGRRWEDEVQKLPDGRLKTVSAQRYAQRDYTEEELLAVSDDLIAEAKREKAYQAGVVVETEEETMAKLIAEASAMKGGAQ